MSSGSQFLNILLSEMSDENYGFTLDELVKFGDDYQAWIIEERPSVIEAVEKMHEMKKADERKKKLKEIQKRMKNMKRLKK